MILFLCMFVVFRVIFLCMFNTVFYLYSTILVINN